MSRPRAGPSVPSVGDLKDVPVSRLFEEAHRRRLTGALNLQAGEKKKTILFEEGMIVGARSNLLQERLGQVLVRMGKIDADACGDALALQKTRRQNMGDLAIDLGLVGAEDLQEGLRFQAEDRIGELFRWEEGAYAFVPVDPGAAKDSVLRISAGEAVLIGVRRGYDGTRLRRALAPHARKYPSVVSTTSSRLGEVHLAPEEEAALAAFDGRAPLSEAVRACGLEARRALALVVGTLTIGLLEMRDAPAGAGGAARGLRERILERAWTCDAKDHYAVLGVSATASTEEIRDRYIEFARHVHPDRLGLDAPADLRSLAQAVFARIVEAHTVLASAEARAAFNRQRKGQDVFAQKAQEAEGAMQAEMQYQKGLVYLRKRSLREAVEAFRRAVNLCPDEGEYRAHLGWAIHRAALAAGLPSPPEAREELDRAIALRPRMDHAHVFLGNLRKAEGDAAGAEACYMRAAEINPGCTEAQQELRVIAMRREKGKGTGPGKRR